VSNTKQYDNYADLITFTRASTGTALRHIGYGAELITNGTFDTDSDWTTITFSRSSGTASVTIDNVSVKEVIFDRATDPLVLFNHPTNTPRIEYDANGNRRGLLIEEARTNLLTYSEVVKGTGWVDSASTSTNLTDGALGVWDGVSVATNGGAFALINASDVAAVNTGDVLTFRVWVKAGTSGRVRVNLRQVDPVNASRVLGEFGSVSSNISSAGPITSIREEDWGNGIVAVSGTITVNFTGDLQLGIGPDSDVAGETVIAYAAQLEAGSFPTSYISTSGAAASRAADVASIPTSAFGYNQKAGTVVVDFETQYGTPVGFPRIWEIGGATSGVDRVYGFISAANSQIRCGVLANGVTAADFSVKTDPTPASGKLAFAFADADFSGVIDGGSPVTDTSGSFTTPSIPRNTLKIGGPSGSAASNMGGHIKSIQYYPRRLTNSQLQRLTS
jgi:hypothetical protein